MTLRVRRWRTDCRAARQTGCGRLFAAECARGVGNEWPKEPRTLSFRPDRASRSVRDGRSSLLTRRWRGWIRTIGPRHERAGFCCGRRIAGPNGGSQKGLFLMRYRWFESISLQRRVRLSSGADGQGRHAEARDLLAPVFSWFTEGFDARTCLNVKSRRCNSGGSLIL